jgi:hypothetical protein
MPTTTPFHTDCATGLAHVGVKQEHATTALDAVYRWLNRHGHVYGLATVRRTLAHIGRACTELNAK